MNDEQAIFLAGNISEGFTAFGPYEDFGAAADAHDFSEGWVMSLQTRAERRAERADIETTIDKAREAFWSVVTERHPETATGDLDANSADEFNLATANAVHAWIALNEPEPQ